MEWNQIALKACPHRKDFYAKLVADPDGQVTISQQSLDKDLNEWLAALDVIVKRTDAFYEKGGHGKGF
jgi:hypothetical protein